MHEFCFHWLEKERPKIFLQLIRFCSVFLSNSLTVFPPTQSRWKMASLLSDCWGRNFPHSSPISLSFKKKKKPTPKSSPRSHNNLIPSSFPSINFKTMWNYKWIPWSSKRTLKKTKQSSGGRQLNATKKLQTHTHDHQVSSPSLKSIYPIFVARI